MLTAVLPQESEAPADPVLGALWQRQVLQEQELEKQRSSLADVKEQLTAVLCELRELKGHGPADKVPFGNTAKVAWTEHSSVTSASSLQEAESEDDHLPHYSFDESMWDAVILLFFRDINGAEKFVLVVGFLLNVGLQLVLLVVVAFDMLDNPYEQKTVSEMIRWRVNTGHQDQWMDPASGKSLVERLCSRTLWSYEQEKYEEMYDYLYKDVPGIVLSMLAIILWVLTTLVEYRQVAEQVLALVALPSRTPGTEGQSGIVDTGEEIQIIAIRPCQRVLALVTVCVPRFVVLASLCVVGCKYLAQTASLADIVLNAMALSFVMDVDELLCQVLLPQRLRGILEKIQPLPCGTKESFINKRLGGFVLKDLLRYTLGITVTSLTIVAYLVPFYNNVQGAASALCGGRHDFTFSGGTAASPTVILKNTSGYVALCDRELMTHYVRDAYGIDYNASVASPKEVTDHSGRQLVSVFNYALKGCPAGMISSPTGVCLETPSSLQVSLPASVRPGEAVEPDVCHRLNISQGAQACAPVRPPTSCLWAWRDKACESFEDPPGEVYERACSENLEQSCEMWRYFLKRDHPTKNCQIVDVCRKGDYGCFSMLGKLRLDVRNMTALLVNSTLTASVVQAALALAGGVDSSSVMVSPDGRPSFGSEPNSGTQLVSFLVVSMPETVKPNTVLQSQVLLESQINNGIASEIGTNNTLSAVSFAEYAFDDMRQLMPIWLHEPSGSKLPGAGDGQQKADQLSGGAGQQVAAQHSGSSHN